MTTELINHERKLYLSYFEDGLADIAGGLPILLFGLGMITGQGLFFNFAWMPVLFFWLLKRWITYPRIGLVRFNTARQKKISTGWIVLLIAGVLSLALGVIAFLGFEGIAFNLRTPILDYGMFIFGAILASAYLLVALLFEAKRFYIYSVFVLAGWLIGNLSNGNPGIPVVASGAIISLIGIGLLVRFLMKYRTAQG